MSKPKLSYEERISAIKEYKKEKGDRKIAQKYGISEIILRDMVATYESQGWLEERYTRYSKEVKLQAAYAEIYDTNGISPRPSSVEFIHLNIFFCLST